MQRPLRGHHQDRDRDDRRPQDHDQAGRVVRPHEQRQAEPGQAGGPHAVHGDDEVQPGQDRRETVMNTPIAAVITCVFAAAVL